MIDIDIAGLLPHRDAMCLLDEVQSFDATTIVCVSSSHRRAPHPMADADGRLGAACGIEYGAQAMALHAALALRQSANSSLASASGRPERLPMGMLVGVRALSLRVDRLDNIAAPLIVSATLLSGDARTAIYDIAIHANDRLLIDGRATVVIEPEKAL